MLVFNTPFVNEIDILYDLNFLEYKINNNQQPILEYLNKIIEPK